MDSHRFGFRLDGSAGAVVVIAFCKQSQGEDHEQYSSDLIFLGWCTVTNIGLYGVTTATLTVFKDTIKTVHSKIAGVASDKLDEGDFYY